MGHPCNALARKIVSAFLSGAFLLTFAATAAAVGPGTGTYTDLHRLTGDEGTNVTGNLVVGPNGNLYGAASNGGSPADCGTLFRMTPAGDFTKLATFDGTNGCNPNGNLAIGSDGNFYGTTRSGGANNAGTVFRLTPGGVLTALASFPGPASESLQAGPLAHASDGNFYCAYRTSIFRVTTSGVLSKLADLAAGVLPDLAQGSDGNLYGIRGGGSGPGVIATAFKATLSGLVTDLAPIPGSAHGPGLRHGFIDGGDGYLYMADSGVMRLKAGGSQLEGLGLFGATYAATSLPVNATDGNYYAEVDRGLVDDPMCIMKAVISSKTTEGVIMSYGGDSGGLMEAPDGYLYGAGSNVIFRLSRPTKLVAKAAITVAPVAGNITFNPQAKLTDAMTNAPVRGANVTFFAGATFLCAGYTDASGLAKCQAKLVDHVREITNTGYQAFFAGDGTYLASDSKGALLCVGTICH